MSSLAYNYTVLLSTFNEEKRVEASLRNFQDIAPVVLIDNFSTDRTVEIARQYTDKIVLHRNPGWGDPESYQVRFDATESNYVLIAYAGQYYPRKLLKLYAQVAIEGRYKAVAVWNQVYSYGQPVNAYGRPFANKSGAFDFFCKSAIDLAKGKIHSELPFTGNKEDIYFPPKTSEYCRISFRDDDCEDTELKHCRYASADSRQRYSSGARTSLTRMIWSYNRHLWGCLLWRGALWQGMPGIINSIWRANYYLGVEIRIWEQQCGLDGKRPAAMHLNERERLQAVLDLDRLE